jgi:hypothetical protein
MNVSTVASGAGALRKVPASWSQRLRWGGSRFDVVNWTYRLRGPLDRRALQMAISAVVARHDALRSSFEEDERLMMCVHREVSAPLAFLEAEGGNLEERECWVSKWLAEEIQVGFDREVAPLFRAVLVSLDEADHVLLLLADHIVTDGWSLQVIGEDLGWFYRDATGTEKSSLPPAYQYSDWMAHQDKELTAEHVASRVGFWKQIFPNGPADLGVSLPAYQDLSEGPERRALNIERVVSARLTDGLRRAASQARVTLFALAGTILVRALEEFTGQDRITLSTSSASRFDERTIGMVGYLATTVWIRTDFSRALSLADQARTFQSDLFAVVEMSDVPTRGVFERLWGPEVRKLTDRVPQVDFLCSEFWGDSLVIPGVEIEATEVHTGEADGALGVFLTVRRAGIDVQIVCVPGELDVDQVSQFADQYVAALGNVVAEAEYDLKEDQQHVRPR